MNERIKKLTELTLSGKMYAETTKTDYDESDLLLPRERMESKRICEYILNQEPKLTEYSCFTGFFNFDESVVGEIFRRSGHQAFREARRLFYIRSVDNLSTMDSQHATADYSKILRIGIRGIISEIDGSLELHSAHEEVEFLLALKRVANALIDWAHKCSKRALEFSAGVQNEEYRNNLKRLSDALMKVPEHAPESFYEAVLSIYLCFSADSDSVGTLDRYLYPFYERDMKKGTLTKSEAAEYLQELFLMLQAATPVSSPNFTRGGESHFCVGGYLPSGEDGFNELSRLIVESMIDLPTYIPQVSIRWTEKMPRDDFRYMLDCERRDRYKRIAFQNDDKRVKAYTEICNIPFEKAVSYTVVGCNEPAFPGSMQGQTSTINLLHSMDTVFHRYPEFVAGSKTYDEFYERFKKELLGDLIRAYRYDDLYNRIKSQDINYISSLVFDDCIKNAKSVTQGGAKTAISSPSCIGITNVIDSLCVIKQFVYDEELFTLDELMTAVRENWHGYEDMRTVILKKGKFFGNDDETSNYVAQRLYRDLYEFLKDRTSLFGYHILIGDLIGYFHHHKRFGECTKATPDGRYNGDMLKFGLGQSEGRDREGLSALLNSIAKADPTGIGCGSSVTNITLDEKLMKNDEAFEKTVDMLLTYFKTGGVHFQLNYVSREDLICAKKAPDEYKNLRVRVSGFSDYFVKLNEAIQDEVISRTEKR